MLSRQKQRKLIDKMVFFSVVFLSTAGLMFLSLPVNIWPKFYNPGFFGFTSIVSAVSIILLNKIFRAGDNCQRDAVMFLRLSITIAIMLNLFGELYLYQLYRYGFQYDKVLHFISPILILVSLVSLGQAIYHSPKAILIRNSVMIVLIGSVLWEVMEFVSDIIFKTTEFGIYGQQKFTDTSFDILFDVIGVVTAVILLKNEFFYKIIVEEYCQGKKI
jgi:hypothetical protein